MTDELEGGDHIVDFTSAGPKNYGYVTKHGKVCCKVRGFTLHNVRGASQLNYQIMWTNLLDKLQDPLDERRDVPVVNPHFFTRDPATKDIRVKPHTKKYRLVFDKRVVDPATLQILSLRLWGCRGGPRRSKRCDLARLTRTRRNFEKTLNCGFVFPVCLVVVQFFQKQSRSCCVILCKIFLSH